MIIGYAISPQHNNDSYMFLPSDANLPKCPKCGYVTNFDYISPLFKLNKRKYDVSDTYDLRFIVSLKFKEFCVKNNYKGIEFKKLPNDPGFFKLEVKNIIKFDTEKVKLRYYKYCEKCHNYESITPGYPIFLKGINKKLADGFYATDVHFASANEKSPIFVIGIETYEKMKKEKFKGIFFSKVEQND
jgi:hypothetical protein